MQQVDHLLETRFPYYRKLLPAQKRFFIYRVRTFMQEKEFSTRQDLVLTNEMRILISAAAVQVTFGLEKFMLDTFSQIIIYPEKYYSRITKAYHKGDVNLAGIIALSWKDFLEGYENPTDNRNLGLHEMGHAVRFDAFNGEHDEFFNAYFIKWTRFARDEYGRVRDEKHPVFREYAGSNINEFLSVCIEHFFETPEQFKKQLPELYNATCILLNQDPTQTAMGIGIRYELLRVWVAPPREKAKWSAWSGSLGAILLFTGIFIFSAWKYFSAMSWNEMHIAHSFFLLPFALWMGVLSYRSVTLKIHDRACVMTHWPGISIFPSKTIPYEHIFSIEVWEDENHFNLHYLRDGVLHEKTFEAQGDSINDIKEFMDEKKVRVREYKMKPFGSRPSRR